MHELGGWQINTLVTWPPREWFLNSTVIATSTVSRYLQGIECIFSIAQGVENQLVDQPPTVWSIKI